MKRHKWHKEISAFTNGEQIQFQDNRYSENWQDVEAEDIDYFDFRFFNAVNREFRIKPRYITAYTQVFIYKTYIDKSCFETQTGEIEFIKQAYHNLKLIFEDKTFKLIKAEPI